MYLSVTVIAVITVSIYIQVFEVFGSLAFPQVIQKSKQWWLVRNTRGQEGNVPQNVLEPVSSNGPMEDAPVSKATQSSTVWAFNRFDMWHFILFTLPHSGTVGVQLVWTWAPQQHKSKPGWNTKVSPECERQYTQRTWELYDVNKTCNACWICFVPLRVAALWTASGCWLVNCFWGWPRMR